ncbi:MAG: potassium transporter Kup [Nevskia sp.]|nr:potassium transporter Kup [Nevskia sp.]
MSQDNDKPLLPLSIGALGVVYGDIGTSPIYALRECFFGGGQVTPDIANVLGVLSLIVWSLILVISVKYLVFVMRADNHGEGGIIALVALLNPWKSKPGSGRYLLMMLGLFGGALLYGDGTITPAISVLSAVEGLKVATPALQPYVIPITLVLLIALFALQPRGTGGIGAIFGPVLILWFLAIAALGVVGILRHPEVLKALNPWYALDYFLRHGFAAFAVLGSVFLAVTGGEALYADMGHFGRGPIRYAWFSLVLPSLLLNYFGQGALVLGDPGAKDPFYNLAPAWAIYPLVVLAGAATVIASQAVISGAFSLTRQLVQLRQLPPLDIVQTSSDEQGQIYIPLVNWVLMLATLGLVLGFKTSDALSSAYGIAVSATMVITTVLAFFVARRFDWHQVPVGFLAAFLLVFDVSFFASNLVKIEDGGWYPVGTAVLSFAVMFAWASGRRVLGEKWSQHARPAGDLAQEIERDPPYRIPGTAVFFSAQGLVSPNVFRHLQRHRVLQKEVLLLTVLTSDRPRVPTSERLQLIGVSPGITRVVVRYGFMQSPNIPLTLRLCGKLGLQLDFGNITYYVGRETLIATRRVGWWWPWRRHLFVFLARNAMRNTAFYRLPPEDIVELGFQVEI